MNKKEALTRIKTGNFNNDYGFDWQILVNVVGALGEMFRSGRISEIVRCKNCKHHFSPVPTNGVTFCKHIKKFVDADWFCADGDRGEENA